MLEVLNSPSPEDEREGELRAMFIALAPDQAHGLFRRVDAGNDPFAEAFRRFIRRRR